MTRKTLLVVDDEHAMRRNIRDLVADPDLDVLEAEDAEQALDLLEARRVNAVLLDVNLPGMDGLACLERIKLRWPALPVIIFTAYGTSERVIEAMKMGAYDYIQKPFDAEDLLLVIGRSLEYAGLLEEVRSLKEMSRAVPDGRRQEQAIIGQAPCMQHVFKQVGQIAASPAPVLVVGESGTGKELVSDAIQRHSDRAGRPYVKVNCGALSESLLESEIFGHEKGAFTGADSLHLGHFEMADGGTLMLDEIASMSPRLQVRLLRVLQHGTFYRVGGDRDRKVDVRLVCLSNRVLEDEVKAGNFREDLYYRINVIRINLPPLRDRIEDIPLLVRHFLERYASGREFMVPETTWKALMAHDWPGNVRELENAIQRAVALSRRNVLTPDLVPREPLADGGPGFYRQELAQGRSLRAIMEKLEKRIIAETLAEQGGNRSRAAEALQVHRRYLYSKMKKYGLR
ncbi:MAG: sigma-54 dependent transcriptional regulator [Candidatus Krumholzibacteriia bacterium]